MVSKELGLRAGFEGAQYSATSLVVESRVLAYPASVQSISANANFQDVVSMGMTSALKARQLLSFARYVLAFELLTAAQALEFRNRKQLGAAGGAAYSLIRRYVPKLDADRATSPDLERVAKLIADAEVVHAVEARIGKLAWSVSPR